MKPVHSVIFLPFLIILLLVTSVIGGSDEWVEYGRSTKGDIFLYNKVSIKHVTKDIVQVWGKDVFSDEGRETYIQYMRKKGHSTEGLDKLSQSLTLLEIDCKKKRYWSLSMTEYDKDGNVLESSSTDKPDWSYVVPDSRMDKLRKKVCK